MAYKRKTRDVYRIEGFYCGEWECVTTETDRKSAVEMLRCYDENEPYLHRIRKGMERLTSEGVWA